MKCFTVDPFLKTMCHVCIIIGIKQCRFLAYSFHAVYYPFNSVRIKFFHDYNQMALSGGSTPVTLFPLEKMFIDNRLVEPIYKLFIQTDDDQIISDVKRIINQTKGCRRFNRCRPI